MLFIFYILLSILFYYWWHKGAPGCFKCYYFVSHNLFIVAWNFIPVNNFWLFCVAGEKKNFLCFRMQNLHNTLATSIEFLYILGVLSLFYLHITNKNTFRRANKTLSDLPSTEAARAEGRGSLAYTSVVIFGCLTLPLVLLITGCGNQHLYHKYAIIWWVALYLWGRFVPTLMWVCRTAIKFRARVWFI